MRWLRIWLLSLWVAARVWGALVPDGTVVSGDSEGDHPPPTTQQQRSHLPSAKASPVPEEPSATPTAASPTPTANRRPRPGEPVGRPRGSDAFAPSGSEEGESRQQIPLVPAPVPAASTAPLWAALLIFLSLAAAGFWLAQTRRE